MKKKYLSAVNQMHIRHRRRLIVEGASGPFKSYSERRYFMAG